MARRTREFRSDGRGKRPNPVLAAIAWLASAVITAAAAALVMALFVVVESHRPGPTSEQQVVVIPRGAGAVQIARHLEAERVIRNAIVFRASSLLYAPKRSLKAGEYAIPAGASMRAVLDQIASGRVMLHPITIPEGFTSQMVVEVVNASDVLSGDPVTAPPEGSILPETYKIARGTDRAALIKSMASARNRTVDELWAKRAKNLPISSKEEAVILASIVEKETGLADERPLVAAVFVNRLRRGMRLESDPTIIYGVSQGKALGRGITRSELDRQTQYNTYKIDGLPPTPIANPGRAAIAAVLNPPSSKDLFFVADGSGGHAFAATLAEHQRNVARWREIERNRR
jgi:UPF0755 protein